MFFNVYLVWYMAMYALCGMGVYLSAGITHIGKVHTPHNKHVTKKYEQSVRVCITVYTPQPNSRYPLLHIYNFMYWFYEIPFLLS